MMFRKDSSIHLLLGVLVCLTLYPFVFMLITSLKSNEQVIHQFWRVATPMHWGNYAQAWLAIKGYILNSVFVSVCSVIGVSVVSSLSAYAFARHKFPGSNIFFYAILSVMMVPSTLTLISSFMWMKEFPFTGGNDWLGHGGSGLLNSHWALILPYIAGGQVFATLILRGFIAEIPEEIFEAARMDGASEIMQFWRIVVPLSKPIIGTVAIMNLLGVWNDFVWPLIILSDDAKRTLTIGLAFFRGSFATSYGPLMAGYAIACIPLLIIFCLAMRYFIEGLTSGAMKA